MRIFLRCDGSSLARQERDTQAGSEEYIVIVRSRIQRETKTMYLLLAMGKGHDENKELECAYRTVHYILKNSNKGEQR